MSRLLLPSRRALLGAPALLLPKSADAAILILANPWVLPGMTVDLDFVNQRYLAPGAVTNIQSMFSVTRASTSTDLTPLSASGAAYQTFANNTLRISPGLGAIIEPSAKNNLLNSATPATQTTASLSTGTYVLWVNGSGSALASGATATITGAASATNGSPNTFVVTVAGTVTVTVTGSLNAFQLEANASFNGAQGSTFIPTGGTTVTRAADVVAFAAGSPPLTILNAAVGSLFYKGNSYQGAKFIGDGSAHIYLEVAATLARVESVSTAALIDAAGTSITSVALKCAVGFDASSRSLVHGGGTVATDSNPFAVGTPSIKLGSNTGTSAFLFGAIQRLAFSNVKLANSLLQNYTT